MENYERDFKGIWIPKIIWLDSRLNMIEKGICAEIDSLDNGKGCFASNKYLADFCQCSETKVSTSISKLIDLGYICLESFNGRQRILKSRLSNFERQTLKKSKAKELNTNNINNNIYYKYNLDNTLTKKEKKQVPKKQVVETNLIQENIREQEPQEKYTYLLTLVKEHCSILVDRYFDNINKGITHKAGELLDLVGYLFDRYSIEEIIELLKKVNKTYIIMPKYAQCDLLWVLNRFEFIKQMPVVTVGGTQSKTQHFVNEREYSEEDIENLYNDIDDIQF